MLEFNYETVLQNFDNVCRLCLAHDLDCIQIFCENGLNDLLSRIIDFVLTKVDKKDGFPNNICRQCLKCMNEFADLENNCLEAYEVLCKAKLERDSAQYIEADVEPLEDEEASNIKIEELFDSNEEVEVEYLDEEFIDEEYKCEDGDVVVTFNDEDVNSTDNSLKIEVSESKNLSEKKPRPTKEKECKFCGKHVQQMSKHMLTHSCDKRFECNYCGKKFRHDTTLRNHIKIHLNIRKYKCEECDKSFCDRSSHRYHMTKHSGVKNFKCSSCDKAYFTCSGLYQHIKSVHSDVRNFVCDICDKQFYMKSHYKDHMQTHSVDRPYECPTCLKVFKRPSHLNNHMQTHTKDGDSMATGAGAD